MAKDDLLGGAVPLPRATRPMELPNNRGTADIILQAAQVRSQRQMQEAALQQKAVESLNDSVGTAMSLLQRKREMDLKEKQVQATSELADRLLNMQPQLGTDPTTGRRFAVSPSKNGPKVTFESNAAGGVSQDPNRLLTTLENEKYGTPAGTRLSDVKGQVPVSPMNRGAIADLGNAFAQVGQLRTAIEQLGLKDGDILERGGGAAVSKLKSLDPATKEGKYAVISKNLSNLARAYGERGVLTDRDVNRIVAIMPGFLDSQASATDKIDEIESLFAAGIARKKMSLQGNVLEQSISVPKADFLRQFEGRSKEDKIRILKKAISQNLVS